MPNESNLEQLAKLLEKAGYEKAMYLIINEIIPLAKKHSVSIYRALLKYCEGVVLGQDQNVYQLHLVLPKIPMGEIEALDIHTPL